MLSTSPYTRHSPSATRHSYRRSASYSTGPLSRSDSDARIASAR